MVRLRDPQTGVARLFPPGGAVEPGESPLAAAVRETREETGFAVTADPASELLSRYDFSWNGKVYACETHWFRAWLLDDAAPAAVDDADYNEGVSWLPVDEAIGMLSFHAEIARAVAELVRRT